MLNDDAEWVDDRTLLISTNVDREMIALARVDIDEDGSAQPPEIIAEHGSADLADMEVVADNRVALIWNHAGRSELAFHDLDTGETTDGPDLPAEVAGGLTANADKKRIYIVRANGAVSAGATSSKWFRRSQGRGIEPGDTVVVPLDVDRMPRLVLWQSATSILFNLALAAAAVASL